MKGRVMKSLIIQMIGGILTQGVILGYNPLAVAWISSVTAMGGGYILLFPVMIIGMYYSMGIVGCIKYGTLMVSVIYMVLLYKKNNRTVNLNMIAVITGASVIIMELGEWFMETDLTTLYGENILYDSYYQLLIIALVGMVSGSGSMMFSIAIKGFMDNAISFIVREKVNENAVQNTNDRVGSRENSISNVAMGYRFLADRIMNLPGVDSMNTEVISSGKIASRLSGEVCTRCVNSGVCWGNNAEKSKKYFMDMIENSKSEGRINIDEISEGMSKQCMNQNRLVLEANNIFERARLNFAWRSRMEEGRTAVAMQLNEMAEMIDEVINRDVFDEERFAGAERKIETVLRSMKQHPGKVDIQIISRGVITVSVRFRKKADKRFDRKRFLQSVSEILQTKMLFEKCNDYSVSLIQDANYEVLFGLARRAKDKEFVSGDNYSIAKLKYGQCLLSICDGMGVGQKAGRYSGIVLDLLEQLIKYGFKKETGLKLINSALMLGNQWDSPMAIDVGMIDLYAGTCEILKMGAACTYIKRGNWVECVKSETLPIGALKNPEMESVSKKLYGGDFVVMVSDGIIDGVEEIGGESFVGRVIMSTDTNNPQKMANHILDAVLNRMGDNPKDDMTVLVAGIWES